MWQALRSREMEARATASTGIIDRFLPLPEGFIKMRQLQITYNDSVYDIDQVPLKYMTIIDNAGVPYEFAVTTQLEFNRVSDQAYTIEMDYYRKLSGITQSNPTNGVLTNHPTLYLAGCLAHAFRWAQVEDRADYWGGKFQKEIADINNQARKGRYGPSPAMRQAQGMIV